MGPVITCRQCGHTHDHWHHSWFVIEHSTRSLTFCTRDCAATYAAGHPEEITR